MATSGPALDPDSPSFHYDEMAYFHENCREYGLPWEGSAAVERVRHTLDDGRTLSGLRWGEGSPQVVFVHGGAQNAHTWDTVVLALRPLPALALDLPGHGHSDWRGDARYDPRSNAADLAHAIDALAPGVELVVGMSLGGLSSISLAAARPDLVPRLVVVDVTPGVDRDKAKEIHDFIEGPQSFPSFTEIFDRTVEFNPTRTPESLRRGILHNAHREPDGSWRWNYDRTRPPGEEWPASADLWDDVSATRGTFLLLRGALSPVVDDADEAELLRRRPDARVTHVEGAGHSIQGDRPLELAEIVRAELDR